MPGAPVVVGAGPVGPTAAFLGRYRWGYVFRAQVSELAGPTTVHQHDRVNRWLMDAPRWVLGVVVALPVGAAVIFMTRAREDANWTSAIIQGVVVGVVVGAVMGPFLHRQNRRTREAIGDVPDAVRRRAGRAALWGPVPVDPDVRRTALRFAEHGLAQASRRPLLARIAGAVFVASSVYLGLTQSPWWWAATAFWAALLVLSFLLRPRLRRRIELLRG